MAWFRFQNIKTQLRNHQIQMANVIKIERTAVKFVAFLKRAKHQYGHSKLWLN